MASKVLVDARMKSEEDLTEKVCTDGSWPEQVSSTNGAHGLIWPEQTAICYGHRIRLSANSVETLLKMESVLPPGARLEPCAADTKYSLRQLGDETYVLRIGRRVLMHGADLDSALAGLETHIQRLVARHAADRMFVHAGVVGWHGQAILILGRSGSGKTTLVRELIEGGATYYSDEYAVIDANGLIYPYARRLSVRAQAGQRIRFAAAELGARTGSQPLSAALVLATSYRAGAPWSPVKLTAGETLLALFQNTVLARAQPQRAITILGMVAKHAVGIYSLRSEKKQVASELLKGGEICIH